MTLAIILVLAGSACIFIGAYLVGYGKALSKFEKMMGLK